MLNLSCVPQVFYFFLRFMYKAFKGMTSFSLFQNGWMARDESYGLQDLQAVFTRLLIETSKVN